MSWKERKKKRKKIKNETDEQGEAQKKSCSSHMSWGRPLFLFILATPLLSISLVVFSVPCLIVGIICCDLHSECILHGAKQGATHATPRPLLHSGCWCKVVRCACLCPAVLLCCACGCGLYMVYIYSPWWAGVGLRGLLGAAAPVPDSPWQACGNLSVIGNRMRIGNRDTFFPDMIIADVITDLSHHPIRYETLLIVSNTKYLQQYNTPYQVWYIQYAIWWGEIGVMTWWRHRNICEHVWSAKCQALFAVSLQQNQSMKQSPTVHSTIHHVTAWAHESHKTVTHAVSYTHLTLPTILLV